MTDLLDEFIVYGTVTVGERGQVVIPSKARKEFNIKPGDLLLVVKAPNTGGLGLAMLKADLVKELMERIVKRMEIRGSRRPKRE